MPELKAGDTVRLKSGGPAMTVLEIVENMHTKQPHWAKCQWFDGKGELKEEDFLLISLVPHDGKINF